MLFEKKFSDNDVVSLKLASGEEVLGRFVSEDLTSITLSKPLMIAMTPKGPAMAPLMMTVNPDNGLVFSKSQITVSALTDRDIGNQYVFQTTGIQPVSAGSIVTS